MLKEARDDNRENDAEHMRPVGASDHPCSGQLTTPRNGKVSIILAWRMGALNFSLLEYNSVRLFLTCCIGDPSRIITNTRRDECTSTHVSQLKRGYPQASLMYSTQMYYTMHSQTPHTLPSSTVFHFPPRCLADAHLGITDPTLTGLMTSTAPLSQVQPHFPSRLPNSLSHSSQSPLLNPLIPFNHIHRPATMSTFPTSRIGLHLTPATATWAAPMAAYYLFLQNRVVYHRLKAEK